jgi:hypothetical protein
MMIHSQTEDISPLQNLKSPSMAEEDTNFLMWNPVVEESNPNFTVLSLLCLHKPHAPKGEIAGKLRFSLHEKTETIKATYGGRDGAKLYFFLENGLTDNDFFSSETIVSWELPHKDPLALKREKDKLAQSFSKIVLPMHDLFLDPISGWLMTSSGALDEEAKENGTLAAWEDYSLLNDNPDGLPQGLSFVWSLPQDISKSLSKSISFIPSTEKILIVTHGEKEFLEAGEVLKKKNIPFLCAEAYAPLILKKFSLRALREDQREAKEKTLKAYREEENILKKAEEDLNAELMVHRSLETLNSNLNFLRDEIASKENDWFLVEVRLAKASAAWESAKLLLDKSSKGIVGFLKSKNTIRDLRIKEKKAKEELTFAEKAEATARREREDFVREAKTLKDELLDVISRAKFLPHPKIIEEKLKVLKNDIQNQKDKIGKIIRLINQSPIRPIEGEEFLSIRIFLVRPFFEETTVFPYGTVFDNVMVISPLLGSHKEREKLLGTSEKAIKRFIVISDFSPLAWSSPAPIDTKTGLPAWRTYIDSSHQEWPDDINIFPGKQLGTPFLLKDSQDKIYLKPDPSSYEGLLSLNIQEGVAICPITYPHGLSLRAPSEGGPVSPVTALTSVKLALNYLENKNNESFFNNRKSLSFGKKTGEKSVIILSPSPSQAKLTRAIILDFAKTNQKILVEEPINFENFPKAALVILDTALVDPHTTHPMAKGKLAHQNLIRALALSGGAIVIVGSEEKLIKLDQNGPLGLLYRKAQDKAHFDARFGGISFFEALLNAEESVFVVLPPINKSFWPSIAPHFFQALRKKVKLTILMDLPPEELREYPGAAIRDLRISGATVLLSQGFPDFLGIVDNKHFSWGHLETGKPGNKSWGSIYSCMIPEGAKVLADVFQLPLIEHKLGKGSFRNCPVCGWAFVLINQDRTRDFGDKNSLKIGCLNENCPNHKRPRPLSERWPFSSTPTCKESPTTNYQKVKIGKTEFWICPKHPSESTTCPRYRVIPGDPD